MNRDHRKSRKFPVRGWVGLVLIAAFWYLNWNVEGLRTHYGFFPLWLGYCLLIDAITFVRKGDSLIRRSLPGFILLFLISAPAWWLFEMINRHAPFWHYTERNQFSDLEYFLYASLSFSSVIPAVFGTSELAGTFRWVQGLGKGPRIGRSTVSIRMMFILGLMMFICIFVFPEYSAAFVWMSLYLMLDPLNHYLGNRTLIRYTGSRDWREVAALWTGCLICGFFWEMWNFHSSPKWYYTVPHVGFWHVFEMPLLGYLGYLPFALELFALYHLVTGVVARGKWQDFLQLIPPGKSGTEFDRTKVP